MFDELRTKAIKHFNSAEGMMTTQAAHLFCFLLEQQASYGIIGMIVETGVFKGKSAALLCHYQNSGVPVYLVDIGFQEHTEHLDTAHDKNVRLKGRSEDFQNLCPDYEYLIGKVRLLHADGNHSYENVWSDIDLAHKLLGQDGILILDDFHNPHFPQVAAATYGYLREFPDSFRMFLIGGNKGVLCRPSQFRKYYDNVLSNFQNFMQDMGTSVQLSKTDKNQHFDVISFQPMSARRNTPIYGEKLYGHFFQETCDKNTKIDQVKRSNKNIIRKKIEKTSKLLSHNPFALTKRVYFELSDRCNLAPYHKKCPVNLVYEKEKQAAGGTYKYADYLCKGKYLPLDAVEKSLQDLGEFNFDGVINFHRYNDPLINLEYTINAVALAARYCPRAQVLIYTNGLQIDKSIMTKLIDAGVTDFTISIYHDNIEAKVKELSQYIEEKQHQFRRPVRLQTLGFTTDSNDDLWGDSALDDRLTIYDRAQKGIFRSSPYGNCRAPMTHIEISCDGDFLACCMDWKNSIKFGNIKKQSLKDICRSPKAIEFYAELQSGVRSVPICKACGWAR